jgi:hypothetical protein
MTILLVVAVFFHRYKEDKTLCSFLKLFGGVYNNNYKNISILIISIEIKYIHNHTVKLANVDLNFSLSVSISFISIYLPV